MTQSSSLLIVSVILLSIASSPAAAQDLIGKRPCAANVERQLETWKIPQDDISSIDYIRKWGMARRSFGNRPIGVNAWISLKSCSGSLVVDMRQDCSVIQGYARGDCGSAIK